MRSIKSSDKRYYLFAIIFSMALVIGCSGGDGPLDEQGGRYVFDLNLIDGDQDNTHDIDLTRILDCNGDGNFDDPETFTQVYGDITVSVATDAPGIRLRRYTINYIPTPSLDEFGDYQDPPDIPSQQSVRTSEFVDSGETATENIIIMTFDTKDFVVNNFPPTLFSALYTIEVEVVYEDYEGNEETYKFYRDVTMSFFDRC